MKRSTLPWIRKAFEATAVATAMFVIANTLAYGAPGALHSALIGDWREIRGHYQDIMINNRLVLAPSPFGRAELTWSGERNAYEARFDRSVNCPYSLVLTNIYSNGRVDQTNLGDYDNVRRYHDSISVELDPSGFLNVRVIDRSADNECRVSTVSDKTYVFRHMTQQELDQRRLARERYTRSRSFENLAGSASLPLLQGMYAQGVDQTALDGGFLAALKGKNKAVMFWLLPMVAGSLPVDAMSAWSIYDRDAFKNLLEKFDTVKKGFSSFSQLAAAVQTFRANQVSDRLGAAEKQQIEYLMTVFNYDLLNDTIPAGNLAMTNRKPSASSLEQLAPLAQAAASLNGPVEWLSILVEHTGLEAGGLKDRTGRTPFDYAVAFYHTYHHYCSKAAGANPEAQKNVQLTLAYLKKKIAILKKTTTDTDRERTSTVMYDGFRTSCRATASGGLNFNFVLPYLGLTSPVWEI